MQKITVLFAALLLAACGKNTDKIGEADTVFNLLGKNDRIEVEGFDDPDVKGVACYLSYAKKGGLKEAVNLEEDRSDASVSCVQTAPVIEYNEKAVSKPSKVFKRSASLAFKTMQIIRYYDAKRRSFTYLVYSDRVIQGSPQNSISSVSCYNAPAADPKLIEGQSGKQIYGSCVVTEPAA